MKLKKQKIITLTILLAFIFTSPNLANSTNLGEEFDVDDEYILNLIEVENIEEYSQKDSFVDVIIGISSSIEIHQKIDKIHDFEEVISIYSNDSESIEDQWALFSEEINIPVASTNFIYKYINAISIKIPFSWISALSDGWFTRYIERNSVCHIDEDTLDWGVDRIDAERVWNGSEDAVDIANGEPNGSGASILIIDTGWDSNHEDLSVNPNNFQNFINDIDFDERDIRPPKKNKKCNRM